MDKPRTKTKALDASARRAKRKVAPSGRGISGGQVFLTGRKLTDDGLHTSSRPRPDGIKKIVEAAERAAPRANRKAKRAA